MATGLELVSIFRGLSVEVLDDISDLCERLSLMDGDVLISENDPDNNDLFILMEGRVEIVSNSTGVTSDEVSISKQDKEIFGEISWITGNKRTATIRCVGSAEAIRINGDKLTQYLKSNPAAGYVVMKSISLLLANRLDQTNNLLKQVLWNSNI